MTRNISPIMVICAVILTACQSIVPVSESSGDKERPTVITNITPKTVKAEKKKTPDKKTESINQKQLDEWVARHKYGKALDILDKIPEKDRSKNDRELVLKIKNLAEDYDKRKSEEIEKIYAKGEKGAALKMLKTAFENYPDGTRLFYVKDKIENVMSGYISDIESQLLIVKGEWLLQRSPLLLELSKVKPGDKDVEMELNKNREEIKQIANRLTASGIQAMAEEKLDQADMRLNMANTLHPTSENITALARLDHLRHERKITQRKLSQAREERKRRDKTKRMVRSQKLKQEQLAKATSKLIENVELSLAKGNLVVAKAQFTQLKKLGIRNIQIDALQRSLDKAVFSRIKSITEKGGELYSNGNIQQAITLWKTALEIDPENPNVKRRINRANQVLSKLRQLQNRETELGQAN